MQLALTILILVVAVAVLVAPVVLAFRAGCDADTEEVDDA